MHSLCTTHCLVLCTYVPQVGRASHCEADDALCNYDPLCTHDALTTFYAITKHVPCTRQATPTPTPNQAGLPYPYRLPLPEWRRCAAASATRRPAAQAVATAPRGRCGAWRRPSWTRCSSAGRNSRKLDARCTWSCPLSPDVSFRNPGERSTRRRAPVGSTGSGARGIALLDA